MLALPGPAAHAQSIQETERRLEELKRRQAQQKQQQKPQPASRAEVMLEADAECEVSINGKRSGTLAPFAMQTFGVSGGLQVLDCRSTADSSVWVREKIDAKPGNRDFVRFELNKHVQAAQKGKRWQARGGDVFDTETGLLWTARDSGYDINWSDAWAWCQNKGSGWALPSVSQLQALYQPELPKVQCGREPCPVSEHFSLSGPWFWSNERNGSSEAWIVGLLNGARRSSPVVYYDDRRALCVRRP